MDKNTMQRIKAGDKPVSFELWRKHYRQLTFRQQVDIYNAWSLRYPNQGNNYCLPAVLKAIEEVKQKLNKNVLRIIELGGYQGELAFDVLTCYPNFIYVNYDFCSIATQRTKPQLKRYKFWAVRLKKPFWQTPIQKYDLFITSHTLEHMINEEVFKVLNHVKQTPFIYIQMPIRHIGYDGVGAGHICSLSWLQIEEYMDSLGYKNIEIDYLKRWEARMCTRYQNYTEVIKLLRHNSNPGHNPIFDKKTDYWFWRKFQFHFLKEHGIKPEYKLLDYGCGEFYGSGEYGTRVGPLLIKYLNEGNYYGADVRESVYNDNIQDVQAQEELEAKHPKLIHIENMDSMQISETFDYIWAFSVVIHMTDEILDKFLKFVSLHLKKTGELYVNVNVAPRNTRCYWKGFPVVERPMNFYTASAEKYGLTITDIGSLASFGYRHDPAAERQRMLRVTRA